MSDIASERFTLLELDLPGDRVTPTASAVTPATPTIDPAREQDRRAGQISAEGRDRALADERAATAAGFSIKPPIYAIGSRVNSLGVENFKASRENFEALPLAHTACDRLAELVAAEGRADHVVRAPDLRMLEDGRLTRGGGTVLLTERALSGLCGFVTPGGGSYLENCPPALRAENLNHWLGEAFREDARATDKERARARRRGQDPASVGRVMVPREVTLRTRRAGAGGREAYAVVGPRYSAHDVDKIAGQVMRSDAIPADARAEITYDGYRAKIDVLFHSDIKAENAVAGEIFKAGIRLKTADDGTGSIQISAMVWRNLCLNLIVIDHAKELVTRRSHRGRGLAEAVEAGIAEAMGKVAHFAGQWSQATAENVLDKYGCQDVDAVMRGLVYNKVVHVPGVGAADMHERLMRAWQAEPGYSKASIVNAVTRAAHESTWSRWTDVEDLETTGGALLYAPVWNVKIPEGEVGSLTY